MARRRLRAPGFVVSTRGHSVLKRRSYGGYPSVRSGAEFSDVYVPHVHSFNTRSEDLAISGTVDREIGYSNQSVDQSYDVASQSRHRDRDLLEHANRAIVASETHATPKIAVASRRANRPSRQPVIIPKTQRSLYDEVVIVRSASVSPVRASPTTKPVVIWSDTGAPVEVIKRAAATNRRAMVVQSPERAPRVKRYRPRQAAVRVSVKVAPEPRPESTPSYKRPYRFKSLFARRKFAKGDAYLSDAYTTSSGLKAHAPRPRPTQAKSYRDVEGFSKPKNLLSWKYRLESRMKPEDLLYDGTKAFGSMRDRVRDVHEKMDRHRQLMDRYMTPSLAPEDSDVYGAVLNKYNELESRDPMGSSFRSKSAAPGGGGGTYGRSSQYTLPTDDKPTSAMSETRRRLRRVICKNRRDPSYFT